MYISNWDTHGFYICVSHMHSVVSQNEYFNTKAATAMMKRK